MWLAPNRTKTSREVTMRYQSPFSLLVLVGNLGAQDCHVACGCGDANVALVDARDPEWVLLASVKDGARVSISAWGYAEFSRDKTPFFETLDVVETTLGAAAATLSGVQFFGLTASCPGCGAVLGFAKAGIGTAKTGTGVVQK